MSAIAGCSGNKSALGAKQALGLRKSLSRLLRGGRLSAGRVAAIGLLGVVVRSTAARDRPDSTRRGIGRDADERSGGTDDTGRGTDDRAAAKGRNATKCEKN